MPRSVDASRQMLSHMRREVNQWHSRRDAFRKLYLEDPHGCVPDEFLGDDILYAIKSKFYYPFDAVRSQLEKEFGSDRQMYIYIDPCYDDTTFALLTLQNDHVLLSYGSKPWTFWWKTEAELCGDLRDWHTKARACYRRFAGLP